MFQNKSFYRQAHKTDDKYLQNVFFSKAKAQSLIKHQLILKMCD